MFSSESTNELFAALSKAQSEFKPIPFDKKNPHFGNAYASLSATLEAVRAPLGKNGLAIIQSLQSEGGKYSICTRLVHSSGQYIASTIDLLVDRNNMQGIGSATTYAKRYAVQAMLGVAGDEDDDGNAASQSGKNDKRSQKENKADPVQKDKIAPHDFVLRIGSANDGKKLGELDDETLLKCQDWAKNKMGENPEPKNIKQIRFLYANVKKVLEEREKKSLENSNQLSVQTKSPKSMDERIMNPETQDIENYSQEPEPIDNPFNDFHSRLGEIPNKAPESDAAGFVIKLRELELDGVFGRKIKELHPDLLKDVLKILENKLQQVPKVPNAVDIFVVKTKINEYLKEIQ